MVQWNWDSVAVTGNDKVYARIQGLEVNGWGRVEEGTVIGGEEFTELISSIFVSNASSCIYWGHWELSWIMLKRWQAIKKKRNHFYTYSVKDESLSLERVYFDYCWDVINSDRVESGKMGATSNDSTFDDIDCSNAWAECAYQYARKRKERKGKSRESKTKRACVKLLNVKTVFPENTFNISN